MIQKGSHELNMQVLSWNHVDQTEGVFVLEFVLITLTR